MKTHKIYYHEYSGDAKSVPSCLKHLITDFSSKISNSKILSIQQDMDLLVLLSTQLKELTQKRMTLLFRASENSFKASAFHESCDGHPNTITIIQSHHGNIFGGYTDIPWASEGDYILHKRNTFLFLLHSKTHLPQIWNVCKDSTCEVGHIGYFGPVFGGGSDIKIVDQCNDGKGCNSYIYTFQQQHKDSNSAVLTGSYGNYSVPEYEVFQIE